MKRAIVAILSLMFSTMAYANSMSSTIGTSSLYIYRGINYYSQGQSYASQGRPIVTGGIDYSHEYLGLSAYVTPEDSFNFTSGILEPDTDVISTLSLSKSKGDVSYGVNTNYYGFMKNPSNNMFEYAANLTYKRLRLDTSFINNFVGLQTGYFYSQASFKPTINDNANLIFHVGYIGFTEPAKIDTHNYIDYKVGVGVVYDGFSYELSYSNTVARRSVFTDSISTQDSAIIVSMSRSLGVF
jgi:uncharacterized protein (TIGR02001 family)